MVKLYEVAKEYLEAMEALEGMDQDVVENTLAAFEDDFSAKAIAVASYIENEAATLEALESHKKAVDAKIKAIKNRNESLKEYLRSNMEATGITKISHSAGLFTVSIRKGVESVKISDESKIPDKFMRVKKEPAKTEIKKAIKDGEMVDGAELAIGKSSISIKVGK